MIVMRFYKQVNNGYVSTVGIGNGFEEITENEYSEIVSIIASKPQETTVVGYRLTADLTWESYEKEPIPEADPDAEEALAILLGCAV